MVTALVFTPLKFNSSPLKKDGKGRGSGFLLGFGHFEKGRTGCETSGGVFMLFLIPGLLPGIGSSCFLS